MKRSQQRLGDLGVSRCLGRLELFEAATVFSGARVRVVRAASRRDHGRTPRGQEGEALGVAGEGIDPGCGWL